MIDLGGSEDAETPPVEFSVEGTELGVLAGSISMKEESEMKKKVKC